MLESAGYRGVNLEISFTSSVNEDFIVIISVSIQMNPAHMRCT